jgi:universal stress protein E
MFESIVVLPQGDDPAQTALERAVLCAARASCVTVLEIVHEPLLDGYMGNAAVYEPLRARVLAERREKADALAAALTRRGIRSVGKAIWAARREDAVAEYVRSERVDLILTTPLDGEGGGLSSSDWRLLATSPVPVLMVRETDVRQYRNIVAAVDPFHAHAKPAELDQRILAAATRLRAQTSAALAVLHCYAPPAIHVANSRIETEARDIGAERREALGGLLRDAGLPESAAKVVPGAPHVVIQAMVDGGEADVIVMGALARGRIKEWLIGNTAERVLHRTRVDLLAVNPVTPTR